MIDWQRWVPAAVTAVWIATTLLVFVKAVMIFVFCDCPR